MLYIQVTASYYHELRKLLLLYGTVLTGHYFVVFILLVTCYWKLLKFIANHKKELHGIHVAKYEGIFYRHYIFLFVHSEKNYGAIKVQIIERAQSRTKRRVIYFIGIFILSGFFSKLRVCIGCCCMCSSVTFFLCLFRFYSVADVYAS